MTGRIGQDFSLVQLSITDVLQVHSQFLELNRLQTNITFMQAHNVKVITEAALQFLSTTVRQSNQSNIITLNVTLHIILCL